MTAAELATFKTTSYGRNYNESCDGYGDMEAENKRGWHDIPAWGRDGWNLGEWPYVVIYHRTTNPGTVTGGKLDRVYELMSICEGDRDVYTFPTEADREAATDYLFLWYAAGKRWAPLDWDDREALDAGDLTVDDKYRGPCRV